MNQYQPHGRVSARDPRDRRRAGWDLRFGVLMVFPLICLIVVLYEFLYLQQYTANEAQDAALQERSVRLRRDEDLLTATFSPKATAVKKPATVVNGRRTMILIANYRDSKRYVGRNVEYCSDVYECLSPLQWLWNVCCFEQTHVLMCLCCSCCPCVKKNKCRCSETLKSIFDKAKSPELVKVSVFDQIYAKDGEKQCVDVFCELVGESACRRSQIVSSQIDAAAAKVRAE